MINSPPAVAAAAECQPLVARPLSTAQAARFVRDGFVAVPELCSPQQAQAARERAIALCALSQGLVVPTDDGLFHQLINVWQVEPALRELTFSPLLLAMVTQLAGGRPMRLFHDQLFIKRPEGSQPTCFHQDLPYWPLPSDAFTISAWIALGDITEADGCLTFMPGTHQLRGPASDLREAGSLVGLYPELVFAERVTLPLRSGGCTLHQGYSAHGAGANRGSSWRVALSVIFVERDVRVTGDWHVLTERCELRVGATLPDRCCPIVG